MYSSKEAQRKERTRIAYRKTKFERDSEKSAVDSSLVDVQDSYSISGGEGCVSVIEDGHAECGIDESEGCMQRMAVYTIGRSLGRGTNRSNVDAVRRKIGLT